MDEVTTCAICMEDFSSPRALPCVHSFCLRCLQGHCRDKRPGNRAQCPLCREEFTIPENGLERLRVNIYLQSLVDAKRTSPAQTTLRAQTTVESNAVLKLKFQKLHSIIADNVNAAKIIDFLFEERVLDHRDVRDLQRENNPPQQCRDLLLLLHASQHPEAFIQLYRAISNQTSLHWLVDCISDLRVQSFINSLQERYLKEPTGKCKT